MLGGPVSPAPWRQANGEGFDGTLQRDQQKQNPRSARLEQKLKSFEK